MSSVKYLLFLLVSTRRDKFLVKHTLDIKATNSFKVSTISTNEYIGETVSS